MTTHIDPKTTKVMYLHDRRSGRGVGCIVTEKDTVSGIPRLRIGYSACNPKDEFSKISAREIALRFMRLHAGTAGQVLVPFTTEDNAFTLRAKTLHAVLRAGCGHVLAERIKELLAEDAKRADSLNPVENDDERTARLLGEFTDLINAHGRTSAEVLSFMVTYGANVQIAKLMNTVLRLKTNLES
jgi:hypothetical protein